MQIKLTNALFRIRKRLLIIIMRTFIFLCCVTAFSLTPKHAWSQNEKISIYADQEMTVDAIFDIIIAQTNYLFIYHEDLFKGFPKVQLKKGTIRLYKLLNQSLSAGDLNVIVTKGNTILIKEKSTKNKNLQQQVSGTVIDQTGLPIPGATVLIKGTNNGVATNLEGQYAIAVPDPANVLIFSSLGFEPQEITVGTQTIIDVSLKESISALGEVVINAGYYNTTQREQVGSIAIIDAKTIEKQPVSNPLAAMQGYLPGVNITQDTGTPGGGFNIEIRGKNFLDGDSNPLYIVDGVPFGSETLIDPEASVATHFPFGDISPLGLIDPSNIESIEVLKDADATAIYGARGANGVVLITTKRGAAGKTQIKVNITSSMGSAPLAELLNTQQYLDMRKEAYISDGFTLDNLPSAAIDLLEWDQNRYTNWQELLIGSTVYRNRAHVSFSGGSEQTQFLLSGGYQNETTVYPRDYNYGKASVHSNINHQSADKRFQVSASIDYSADDNQLPGSTFAREAYTLPPNAPAPYDENGDLNWEGWTNQIRNPFARFETKYRSQTNNLILNSVISYRPAPNLEFKANLGYTDSRTEAYRTFPHTEFDPAIGFTSATSSLSFNSVSRQSWIIEPQIHWQKDWGKASLKFLIGTTFQRKESRQLLTKGFGFSTNSQILNLAAAEFSRVDSDNQTEYKYQSVFGRLNFKWDGQYIINLTGRRDGSSRFGPGRQFGNFGAIGTAWIFSEAAFFKEFSLLSFGKLRSSYGITGSDKIEDYQFYDSYGIPESDVDYGGSTLEPTGLFNPIFAWEENTKFEVALELVFLQNRVFLTTAWYKNRSSNQLVGIPLPGSTGFSTVSGNFDATVENTGLEIDFRSINIQNKNFKWTTTFNISVPQNKLVKFDGLESSTFKDRYVVGEPLSIRKLYHTTGVDPDTGVYQFEDYSGNGTIDSGFEDRQWIEQTAPKFYGGLGNTVQYKNWTLEAFFQFKKHRGEGFLIGSSGEQPGWMQNQPISVLNRWQQVGDQTAIQRYTSSSFSLAGRAFNNYERSNATYTDASFIRLRNVSLNYTLPKGTIPGLDVNIYLQGHNLLTFTKYKGADPDQVIGGSGWIPPLRQFTLGLQLGF